MFHWKQHLRGAVGALSALILSAGTLSGAAGLPVQAAYSGTLPRSVMVGMFFNSEEDRTDSVYVSFNGLNFHKISEALTDTTPNDRSSSVARQYADAGSQTLHDPGLQYDKVRKVFWTNSGYTNHGTLIPMVSFSKDLITWTAPGSGSSTNTSSFVGDYPFGSSGERGNTSNFNCAAPEIFVDDDGTVYFTACLGYYANNSGDKMSTYIFKANRFDVSNTNITADLPAYQKYIINLLHADYSPMYSIDLDSAKTANNSSGDLLNTDNYIDSSLFKDPDTGKYYLTVKRDGVTNEIWETDHLSLQADWKRISYDAVTGYEGPCITKANGHYYLYVDKLADYPALDPDGGFGTGDGKRGINVCVSDDLVHWSDPTPIVTTTSGGSSTSTRHGSVITVTDPDAIRVVMNAYAQAGYGSNLPDTNPYHPNPSTYNGWKHSGGKMFWYENGIRQGTYDDDGDVVIEGTKRGREIAQLSNKTWYWLDAIYNGAKAVGKEVAMPYVYQDEAGWDDAKIRRNTNASDPGLRDYIYQCIKAHGTTAGGKYVRYDGNGGMLKGWQTIEGDLAAIYPSQAGNTYYYDTWTGAMAKGHLTIDGVAHYFDEISGVMRY